MVVKKSAYQAARLLRKIGRVLEHYSSAQALALDAAMSVHDMVSNPDEQYYSSQYWHWILPELQSRFPGCNGRILDVGCGQGRLSLRLAKWSTHGSVTGIDLSSSAIEAARSYSQALGLQNLMFHQGDALDFLSQLQPESIDIVVMTEVAFVMPNYRDVISRIRELLKSGGLFFPAFRSQYFNILFSIGARSWESVKLVRDAREGHLGDGTTWFSWHNPEDVKQLLATAGFDLIRLCGIGIASGIKGDPLASVAQPSALSPGELERLAEIEVALAEQYAACGRYILATAVKPHVR